MPRRPATPACIVTPEFPGPLLSGGLGTAVYWQARTLREAGIPVEIFCTGDVTVGTERRWRERFKRELDIEFIEAGAWIARERPDISATKWFPNFTNLIRAQWVAEFLRARDHRVVYLQDYTGHGLRALQFRAAGLGLEHVRFALTLHGPMQWALDGLEIFPSAPEQLVIEHQEEASAKLADRVLAPSTFMREWAIANWHMARRDIRVLPYCFSDPAEGSASVVHGPFDHLVFFGRLETRKGLEIFLEAVMRSAVLGKAIKRVTFLGKSGQAAGQTGSGWINETLGKRASFAWEIFDNKDTFQAWSWLQRQKRALIVAPSLTDNLPYAVIELFQRRVPFLTTSAGGIPEIVGDNPDVLCAPTAAGLRERLERVVTDGKLRVRYDTGFDPAAARTATIGLHHELARESQAIGPLKEARPFRRRSGRSVPEVSVIVPHYNCAAYLQIALDTLAKQKCDFAYEVLVVDDASTRAVDREGFAALQREYAQDERFRLFAEATNRGAGGARNFAARHARGRFFAFFDADNEALPHYLATYRTAMESTACDALTCYVDIVFQDDYEAPRRLDAERLDMRFTPPGPALEASFFSNFFGDTCSIVRRAAFEKVGGFSAGTPAYLRLPSGDWDWDFFAKLAFAGCRLGVVPSVLFRYRSSPGNQQSYNLRRRYLNRSIIHARFSSAEAQERLDWRRLFGVLDSGSAGASARAAGAPETASPRRGLYEFLAHAPDEVLLPFLGRARGSVNDATIRHLRARVAPLLAEWRASKPRIFLYGAGLHTRVLLGTMPELAEFVVGVIDRNPSGPVLGWPCIKPGDFRPEHGDVVVYSSKEYEKAMHAGFAHHPVKHVLLYS